MTRIPNITVVVSYPKSRIVIGAWSITRRKSGDYFNMFVKESTRTYDWLKKDDLMEVWIVEDFWKFATSTKDKTEMPINGQCWIVGVVKEVIQMEGFRMFDCLITSHIKPYQFIFNYGSKVKTISIP